MIQHSTLKPLLVSTPGMVLYETLLMVDGKNVLSPKRRDLMSQKFNVSCYYEFPFFPEENLKNNAPRIDAVANVFYTGAFKFGDSFSVAIEIKESEADLYRTPGQFESYIGKTDYLMLGVKEPLLCAAKQRVSEIPECGVFDIETGLIVKSPIHQNLSDKDRLRLKETFLVGYSRGKGIANVDARFHAGVNVFDLSDLPEVTDNNDLESKEARTEYWKKLYTIREERDNFLDGLPREAKMLSYYPISRKIQHLLL